MRILVVEDEKKLSSFINKGLREEHYTVDVANDGEEGLNFVLKQPYDAIVLDLSLPKMDGLDVLRKVRAENIATPVLVLTARGSTPDKVAGLDAGADDYLTKPFVFEELSARLRSLLRRSTSEKSTTLRAGDLVLDTVSHKARRGDKEIEFTAKEYSLLEYLIRNKGRVLSRSVIAQHVWSYNFFTESNIIDVYINRLRHKVDDGFEKRIIHSIRGVGYRINEDEAE
ncbi:MAG TPA: response regulator transcription factor [Candidatus Kapabacteria bacterium]|nr:response regulator transcription factor [Candidatus Kapabacteria bacterium]